VARDFIGQAPNFFLANHMNKDVNMRILMVKMEPEIGEDLADYLGGKVFTEKRGSITGKLKDEDFPVDKNVYSDKVRTIVVSSGKKNIGSELRVKAIKDELSREQNESKKRELQKRIASLTNGIITLKVGAKTQSEMAEKFYRYEDALSATRAAKKDGYVVGGGITLYQLYKDIDVSNETKLIMKNFCQASLKQIAKNCDLHYPTMLENI